MIYPGGSMSEKIKIFNINSPKSKWSDFYDDGRYFSIIGNSFYRHKKYLENLNIIPVDSEIALIYGLEKGAFLTLFIDKMTYLGGEESQDDVGIFTVNYGWFSITHIEISRRLCISKEKIHTCIKMFKDKGFLKTKLKGSPPKLWYKLNVDALDIDMANLYQSKERGI